MKRESEKEQETTHLVNKMSTTSRTMTIIADRFIGSRNQSTTLVIKG